jgi:alkaline phosphatase D
MKVLVFLSFLAGISLLHADGPYQATGFKTGEVTDTSAIVWTRTTAKAKPNPASSPTLTFHYTNGKTMTPDLNARPKHPSNEFKKVEFSTKGETRDIRYAAPGAQGKVRVSYWPRGKKAQSRSTPWEKVDPEADYTKQFTLSHLRPDSRYDLLVETQSPSGESGQSLTGGFRTAHAKKDPARVVFTVSTGQTFRHRDGPEGFDIYPAMLKLNPQFFVHTGDILYYDGLAKTPELAHWHWQRTYSLKTNLDFHRKVSSYFIKDDHDTLVNDCWPTMNPSKMFKLTFEKGLEIFRQQVPMGKSTYRTMRWGKDLQVWMVEGRDFRSANNAPDGPSKTIWGKEQKAWFKETFAASDATFRILISPTPVVGPDRSSKHDNHANKDFAHEGNEIRDFLATQKNVAVVCGDRHWQYHSIDPRTKVKEFSCGPASDQHAGGWSNKDYRKEIHQYLNVTGGFLSGAVERKNGKPTLTFRFHGSQGKVLREFILEAN